MILNIVVIVLAVLYQLYLWSFGFFAAQDVSMGYFGIPELTLQDIFSDWGVKFKLLIIRIVYYLPLVALAVLWLGIGSSELVQIINRANSIQSVFTLSLGLISGLGVVGLLTLIVEQVVLVAAQYQFSYTNSLLSAFNLAKITRFIVKNAKDLIWLVLLQIAFTLAFSVVLILASILLIIPIIGAIILSILIGFYTSWHTVFMPSLYGQIWHRTDI
jgi:hypothetical protein